MQCACTYRRRLYNDIPGIKTSYTATRWSSLWEVIADIVYYWSAIELFVQKEMVIHQTCGMETVSTNMQRWDLKAQLYVHALAGHHIWQVVSYVEKEGKATHVWRRVNQLRAKLLAWSEGNMTTEESHCLQTLGARPVLVDTAKHLLAKLDSVLPDFKFASQLRVLDPKQKACMPRDVQHYDMLFDSLEMQQLQESGEWQLYMHERYDEGEALIGDENGDEGVELVEWWNARIDFVILAPFATNLLSCPLHTSCVEGVWSLYNGLTADPRRRRLLPTTKRDYLMAMMNDQFLDFLPTFPRCSRSENRHWYYGKQQCVQWNGAGAAATTTVDGCSSSTTTRPPHMTPHQ